MTKRYTTFILEIFRVPDGEIVHTFLVILLTKTAKHQISAGAKPAKTWYNAGYEWIKHANRTPAGAGP
ncbi:MAG: hypothetical protein NVSMB27_07300 [Ktedonobacteraceae bacterium]